MSSISRHTPSNEPFWTFRWRFPCSSDCIILFHMNVCLTVWVRVCVCPNTPFSHLIPTTFTSLGLPLFFSSLSDFWWPLDVNQKCRPFSKTINCRHAVKCRKWLLRTVADTDARRKEQMESRQLAFHLHIRQKTQYDAFREQSNLESISLSRATHYKPTTYEPPPFL